MPSLWEELSRVEQATWVPRSHEQFQKVLAIYDQARQSNNQGEWTNLIDVRVLELSRSVDALFLVLKNRALQARRDKDQATIREICERVDRWGLEEKSRELVQALNE